MADTRDTGSRRHGLRVLLAGDDRLELYALGHALNGDGVEVAGEAQTIEQVIPLVARTRADVLLLSGRLAAQDGFAVVSKVRERYASTRTIVLEEKGDAAGAREACAAGAIGSVSTAADPRNLAAVLIEAARGTICLMPTESEPEAAPALTDRELSVLSGAARGLSNEEIGRELWLSPHTVKSHLHRIYTKLEVANRTEATRWALDNRVLDSSAA